MHMVVVGPLPWKGHFGCDQLTPGPGSFFFFPCLLSVGATPYDGHYIQYILFFSTYVHVGDRSDQWGPGSDQCKAVITSSQDCLESQSQIRAFRGQNDDIPESPRLVFRRTSPLSLLRNLNLVSMVLEVVSRASFLHRTRDASDAGL